MTIELDVFQDLFLRGPDSGNTLLRKAMIDRATRPWHHAENYERDIAKDTDPSSQLIAFTREGGDRIDAVTLILWPYEDGFKIINIVPREVSELGRERYNAALQDFVTRVAKPAADAAGFTIKITPARQGLKDWLPRQAAEALELFSHSANKSTGSAHPMDRERWFAFLLAVHSHACHFSTDLLIRWLVEIEGWSNEIADKLAIEYEFGLALLNEYDTNRD